jgi:gliding motility-associated-like protein
MRFIKLFISSVFALLFSYYASASTFTVISNADAGPGSLREALNNAAANGTVDPDVINFNLAGALTSDRTIRLKTQLPLITANLIIDGTSQPGIPFGISDARVIIEPETSPAGFDAFTIYGDYTGNNVTKAVEIYGLYIRNFANINNLVSFNGVQGSGIYIQGGATGIKIGAPGKGNVICGNIYGIYTNTINYYYTNTSDISIQSNIIGLIDDGKTARSNIYGINIGYFSSILIGGDDPKMGNLISANVTGIGIYNNYYYNTTNQTAAIKNNKIGTDYTGTVDYKQSPLFLNSAFLKTFGINISNASVTTDVSNNLISGQIGYGIFISGGTYSIKSNKIGTDITGTKNLGNYEAIRSDVGARGTIGGSGTSDQNYIGYNSYGVEVSNSNQVLITQNSIFCNTNYGIGVTSAYYTAPYVQVLTFRSDMVGGLATPNCAIELFYSDDCGGTVCQGKTYITTVQSDASGKWSYSGSITGTVVATATNSAKNTSPFSSLNLLANETVIKQYTCAYMGSITIPQMRDGILFHWDKRQDDGTLTPLADTQNINNLDPGIYDVTIQYPGGCQRTMQQFEIKDQRIKIQNLIPPTPQCRQKSFPVNANYSGGTGNVVFKWVDDQGVTKGIGKNPNIPAGTFTLHITDDAGCDVTSDPITIVAKPGPDYDMTNRIISPARCGVAEGAIKGIKATAGIGPLTYSWKTYPAGVEVGTDLDLINVPGGSYTLTLADQSGNECTPYTTNPIFIPQTNSVIIGNANIVQPTCDLNNGSINLPAGNIINASQFRWYGPYGNELVVYRDKLVLTNLAEGNYTLVATNPVTFCNNSRSFSVIRIQRDVYSINPTVIATTCELNNGSISLTFNGIAPVTYRWTNQNGVTVGTTASIKNLAPGDYYLAVTDTHNCATPLLAQYKVDKTPILAWDATSDAKVVDDTCTQHLGSITGLKVTGGVPPYTYTWTDGNGKVAGTNSAVLTNIIAGSYKLHVADQTLCEVLDAGPFTVGEQEPTQIPPTLGNQKICDPGLVTFNVLHVKHGLYKLYKNVNDAVAVLTSVSGEFTLYAKESSDYYVSYNVGSCESTRTPVHVEVLLVDVKFANTITPNGDGFNDYWKISGLEKFPGAVVQVFTRQGQKVYESKDYAIPFNGSSKGTALLAGSYYYIIDLHIPCKLISGNLTLLK